MRAVYVLAEDTIPDTVLCGPCIDGFDDPPSASRVVRRADGLHCIGCDYHADPDCGPGHWCGVDKYDRLDDHALVSV